MNISATRTITRSAIGASVLALAISPAAQAAPLTQPGFDWAAPATVSATGAWAGELRTSGVAEGGAMAWTTGRDGAWSVTAGLVRNGNAGMMQDISGPLPVRPTPDVAARGTVAAVAWSTGSGIVLRRADGGTWGITDTVAGAGASRPAVTIDAQGRPWVAWTQPDGIYMARHDGAWRSLGRLVASSNPRTVRITSHGDGIAAAWSQPASGVDRPRWTVRAATIASSGVAQAVDLDIAASTRAPRPAIDAGGGVLSVAWRREGFVGPNTNDFADSIQVATLSSSWSRTQVHAPRIGLRVHDPRVAVSPQGETAVVYARAGATNYSDYSTILVTRTRTAAGVWSAEQTLYLPDSNSHITMSGALAGYPRFDAAGGLTVTWAQDHARVKFPAATVAARGDDGTWSIQAMAPRSSAVEWVHLLPSADGQRSVALWRTHNGGGVFSVSASMHGPAATAPAAPVTTLPATPSDPTLRPGAVGSINRAQAARDAATARADAARDITRKAPRLRVRLARAERIVVTLVPANRRRADNRRWQVRAPRGTSEIRLDQAGAPAGRYRAEARVRNKVIATRQVTLGGASATAMSQMGAQTGWIIADARIVALSGGRITMDLTRSGWAGSSYRGVPIDASPDFASALGWTPDESRPLRVTMDIQESTIMTMGMTLGVGKMFSPVISGVAALDPEAIEDGQLAHMIDGCGFMSC